MISNTRITEVYVWFSKIHNNLAQGNADVARHPEYVFMLTEILQNLVQNELKHPSFGPLHHIKQLTCL